MRAYFFKFITWKIQTKLTAYKRCKNYKKILLETFSSLKLLKSNLMFDVNAYNFLILRFLINNYLFINFEIVLICLNFQNSD